MYAYCKRTYSRRATAFRPWLSFGGLRRFLFLRKNCFNCFTSYGNAYHTTDGTNNITHTNPFYENNFRDAKALDKSRHKEQQKRGTATKKLFHSLTLFTSKSFPVSGGKRFQKLKGGSSAIFANIIKSRLRNISTRALRRTSKRSTTKNIIN